MIVYRCYNESDNMNYLFLQTFHNNKWKYNDKSMSKSLRQKRNKMFNNVPLQKKKIKYGMVNL